LTLGEHGTANSGERVLEEEVAMTETGSGKKSIVQLILVPSLITLGITILRLEGELHHWGSPWFNSSAGGGGAIIGISWLPIVFGPYFALKLAGSGEGRGRQATARPSG
jgi:hypothetical protein